MANDWPPIHNSSPVAQVVNLRARLLPLTSPAPCRRADDQRRRPTGLLVAVGLPAGRAGLRVEGDSARMSADVRSKHRPHDDTQKTVLLSCGKHPQQSRPARVHCLLRRQGAARAVNSTAQPSCESVLPFRRIVNSHRLTLVIISADSYATVKYLAEMAITNTRHSALGTCSVATPGIPSVDVDRRACLANTTSELENGKRRTTFFCLTVTWSDAKQMLFAANSRRLAAGTGEPDHDSPWFFGQQLFCPGDARNETVPSSRGA